LLSPRYHQADGGERQLVAGSGHSSAPCIGRLQLDREASLTERWDSVAIQGSAWGLEVALAPAAAFTSEDFPFMLQARPGAYLWLGQGRQPGGRGADPASPQRRFQRRSAAARRGVVRRNGAPRDGVTRHPTYGTEIRRSIGVSRPARRQEPGRSRTRPSSRQTASRRQPASRLLSGGP